MCPSVQTAVDPRHARRDLVCSRSSGLAHGVGLAFGADFVAGLFIRLVRLDEVWNLETASDLARHSSIEKLKAASNNTSHPQRTTNTASFFSTGNSRIATATSSTR